MIFPGIDTRHEYRPALAVLLRVVYRAANLRESPMLGDSLSSGRLQLISRNYENREIPIARMRSAHSGDNATR